MSRIRLSLIIPFYDVERYIAQCLDSVYRQDIPEEDFEVICVDDCSLDGSLSIVGSYADKHANLRIVRNRINRKLGGARNAGLEVAQGTYVMFVDSDDLLEDNVLERLCSAAESEMLDVLHFDYENYPERTPLRKIAETEVLTGPELFFDSHFIWYHDFVTAWRKLYRRQFLLDRKIVFAEHIMFEDNDYALLVFANAERAKHIRLDAYNYRFNPESVTRMRHSASHISYWLDLCHRLIALKYRFESEGKDSRFQKLLDGFVRDRIRCLLDAYAGLPAEDKALSRRMILFGIDASMNPYMGRRHYYRIKLGMI